MNKQQIDDAITQVYALRDLVAQGYIKRTSPEQQAMLVLAKAYEDAQAAIQAAVLAERESLLTLAKNVMQDCGMGISEREYMADAIRARSTP